MWQVSQAKFLQEQKKTKDGDKIRSENKTSQTQIYFKKCFKVKAQWACDAEGSDYYLLLTFYLCTEEAKPLQSGKEPIYITRNPQDQDVK